MAYDVEYSGTDPVQLHAVYGVNCYQNAIGYKPITVHFNKNSGNVSYLTLCPGNLAQILHEFGRNAGHEISSYDMKKMLIAQCREDGLEELEARSTNSPIHVPEGKRLVAMLYSNERKDFDFQFHDAIAGKWKNKTPMETYTERDDLPKFLAGGYVLSRLFICPENVAPKGAPKGQIHTYKDQDVVLTLPEIAHPWERGPCLQKTAGGLYLPRTDKTYASPDLSFVKS